MVARRRLTKEQRDQVRSLSKEGLTQRAIADIVGCHCSTVCLTLSPEKRKRKRANRECLIYILYSPAHNLYKIGCAVDVDARIKTLACPDLRVIKTFPGTVALETYIHDRLEPRWVMREWYQFDSVEQAKELVQSVVSERNT